MKTCSGCNTQRPNDWFATRGGKPGKVCEQCLTRDRERNAQRGALGHNKAPLSPQCADCARDLTPNRTVRLGGDCICYACQAKRFGVTR